MVDLFIFITWLYFVDIVTTSSLDMMAALHGTPHKHIASTGATKPTTYTINTLNMTNHYQLMPYKGCIQDSKAKHVHQKQ